MTPLSRSKVLSLVLALCCIGLVIRTEGTGLVALKACLIFVLPLALIWFAEGLGNFAGYVGRGGNVDTPTPAIFIAGLGWLILIVLAVLSVFFLQ